MLSAPDFEQFSKTGRAMADMLLEELMPGRQRERGDFFESFPARTTDPVRIRIGVERHLLNETVKRLIVIVRKLVVHFQQIIALRRCSCNKKMLPRHYRHQYYRLIRLRMALIARQIR